jgi:hypothetical protein
MREVTIKLPEERYEFVMELLANLGLEVASDMEIPEWQKNIVRERIAEYEANPDIAIPWNEARKQIKTKK